MATPITTFSVQLVTGDRKWASTNGDVYIGLCGREFYVDSIEDYDDFQQGDDKTYIFGEGRNTARALYNDPRKPYPIYADDIEKVPAYVRFQPQDRDDEWDLELAIVDVNNGQAQLSALEQDNEHLYLATHYGLYCYLWTTRPFTSPLRRTGPKRRKKVR